MTQGQLFTSETLSQEEAILRHLKSGQAITPLDALNLYRCFRLGARIYGLKKLGHKIESQMIKVASGKRVASYRLVHEKINPES